MSIERLNSHKNGEDYHYIQYRKPYRSTEAFIEWIDDKIYKSKKILDIACGGGANLFYLAQKYPKISFEGIELNKELVDYANELLISQQAATNIKIYQGDWYNLPIEDLKDKYSGIVSFQTLSWLPEYTDAIKCLVDLNPDWIAVSSLFYEGSIDYTIKLKDYTRNDAQKDYQEYYYNIYSLVKVKELFNELGYKNFSYKKFEIDIDLEKKIEDGLGTYTKKLEDGSRIQISGGLMLPWYFIYASK